MGDPTLSTQTWYFTRRSAGSKAEAIVYNHRAYSTDIFNSSLPGVAVENPATLVLKNVDARYNGKYRLSLSVIGGCGESSVEFFVAGKFSS